MAQNTRFSSPNSASLSEEEQQVILLPSKLKAATSVMAHLSACRSFDGSIKDEKASNVGPAGIDIAYHRLGKGDF